MFSISCRSPQDSRCLVEDSLNPWEEKYMDCECDEDGNIKLVEGTPVKPSIAEDFDVRNNAIYRGMQHGILYRMNADPVDFEEKVSILISE